MIEVQLSAGAHRDARFRLRSLRGCDEAMAGEPDAFAATRLLERLLVDADGAPPEADTAWRLPLSDRDRLLAEVYRHHFGDAVESSADCDACGEPFDLRFSLDALLQQLEEERSRAPVPDGAGVYTLTDGVRFRLPSAADQRDVQGLPAEQAGVALLRRCVVGGGEAVDARETVDALEAAMEQAGPLLDQDLPAACPHCGHEQAVRFDIQDHLLAVLQHERGFLVREVHCLARAYGWSLDEILELPRADRRAYARLIQAEGRSRP